MTAEALIPMRTGELMTRLRRHYIKPSDALPGGVFVPECGINGTVGSRCDALYAGFTSTSGRILIGHEVKVSRADWQHELDQPGKSDFWHDNTHRWFVVAPSTDIVPPETLPAGWGLLVVNARSKTRLEVAVKAETRKVTPSWQATRSILARLDTLRAIDDARITEQARVTAEAGAEERYRARREQVAGGMVDVDREQRTRLDMLTRLEEILGVNLTHYEWHENPGEATVEVFAAALTLARAERTAGQAAQIDRSTDWAVEATVRAAKRLEEAHRDVVAARDAYRAAAGNA